MLSATNAYRFTGQSSRANEDEEEELEQDLTSAFPPPSPPSSSCVFNFTPLLSRKPEEISAIFINNNIAYALADCLIKQDIITPLTTIKVDGKEIYEVYMSKTNQNSLLFKVSTFRVPIEHEMSVTMQSLMDSITLKEVIILDGIAAAKFIPSGQDCASDIEKLRTVCTRSSKGSEWCEQILSRSGETKQNSTVSLESGNVITGGTASLLCACEVRNVPAVALLCLREAAFDCREASRFELYWDVFCSKYLPVDGQVHIDPPNIDVYNSLRKRDPFLLSTETLYT